MESIGFVLAVTAVVLATFAGHAETCSPVNTPSLTVVERANVADSILVGRIVNTYDDPHFSYTDDGDRAYWATMEVQCVYKGDLMDRLVNITHVGFFPGLCTKAELTQGSEYVVFLSSTDNQIVGTELEKNTETIANVTMACGLTLRHLTDSDICPDPTTDENCVKYLPDEDHNPEGHDHENHEGHAHEDHDPTGHDHENHEGHDHEQDDHEGHAHEEHDPTGHDHENHEGHDHDHDDHDPAGHDHEKHEGHNHDHEGHAHEDHDPAGHDHENHEGHDHDHGHEGHDHENHDPTGHDHENHEGHEHDHQKGNATSATNAASQLTALLTASVLCALLKYLSS